MIFVKSEDEIKRMTEACEITAEVLEELRGAVAPGITTADLERIANDGILRRGGVPAFKGYRGYPASICASVNSEVIHGIPSERTRLREGDIIGIDLGVNYKGYFGDSAITVAVGAISAEAQKLMRVTEESLYAGIRMARDGNRVSDISHAVQSYVEAHGYSVVRSFVGHGIGKSMHEDPQVPNYGLPGRGPRLKRGMTIAIEPMVNAGRSEVKVLEDGWTAVTVDGSLSAHFEHTVAITGDEPLILTRVPARA